MSNLIQVTTIQSPISANVIYVCDRTSDPYVNLAQLEIMFPNVPQATIRRRLESMTRSEAKAAEIQTSDGVKLVPLYRYSVIPNLAFEFDLTLAKLISDTGSKPFCYALAGYEVKVVTPAPQYQLAPQRDLIDYINAAKSIGIDSDPIIKSLISQRMVEQLSIGKKVTPTEQPLNVTSIAANLGYSPSEICSGGMLGKYVAQFHESLGTTQHGKYLVNVYLPSKVSNTIHRFFE